MYYTFASHIVTKENNILNLSFDHYNRIREEHFHTEQADYGRLFVPKDRNALYNLMLDAMARWKETMDARNKGVMLFYAEKLGIREDELFSRQ